MSNPTLKPGQIFNPVGIFIGAFIPNTLMRNEGLSPLAKLTWARLAQYAGHDGACYPSLTTIGKEVGKSRRQVQRVLNELVDQGFIRRDAPDQEAKGKRQTTRYFFLWHPIFAQSATRDTSVPSPPAPRDTNDPSPRDTSVTPLESDLSPKEVKKKEEDKTTTTPPKPSPKEKALATPLQGCCRSSLTKDEERFIELTLLKAQAEGTIKSTPKALENALNRIAHTGQLDTSDLDFLEKWNEEQSKNSRQANLARKIAERESLRTSIRNKKNKMKKSYIKELIETSKMAPLDWCKLALSQMNKPNPLKMTSLFGYSPPFERNVLSELFPKEYLLAKENLK